MKGIVRKVTLFAATMTSVAFLLAGCSGDDGSNGAAGATGATGAVGASGIDRTIGVVDAAKLTALDLKNTSLGGAVISATIPGNQPVVKFSVYNKENRQGIVGLRTFSLHIAQLKPETNSSNSYWQNYIAEGLPQTAMPARTTAVVNPSTDSASTFNTTTGAIDKQGYTVVDHQDGTYTATFGADIKANTKVPYDATLVHRVAVGVRSVAVPGVAGKTAGQYAGPINPETGAVMANFLNTNGTALVYDFVPATGAAYTDATGSVFARDIVTIAACNQCHTRLEHGSSNSGGHFGSRPDTKVCVICHTPQLNAIAAYGEGDFTTFIHKIHMGARLPAAETAALTTSGVDVKSIHLPMDVMNCTICHKGAVVDSWKTKTTRKACGSCHNDVNFVTGANHPGIGGARTDDAQCVICHTPAYVSSIHATDYSTPNNRQTPAGLTNFKYEIKDVVMAGANTVITFKILSDGGIGAVMAPVTLTTAGGLTGFTGSPSFLLAYNKSAANQVFTTSADYNNVGVKAAQPIGVTLANLADGTKGTLVAAGDGYYTATITAAAATFPVGAKMRTVALQGYYTQAGNGRHTISVVKTVKGDTVRRVVIDSGKCGACHEVFEGHGGNRNIGKDTVGEAICTLCHVPNLSSSGKGAVAANVATNMTLAERTMLTADGYNVADPSTFPEETNNFKDMIHGIHAGSSRSIPLAFVRDRGSVIMYFSTAGIKFPGVLKNCESCHTATSYKTIPATAQVTTDVTNAGTVITLDNNVTAVDAARRSLPNAQDLVTTPFTAACVSCHDLASSKAHMIQNGGGIKVLRSSIVGNNEACATCHGTTGTASIYSSHRF